MRDEVSGPAWSALQDKPQGMNGSALTMHMKNSHAALPVSGVEQWLIATHLRGAWQARLYQIEKEGRPQERPKARDAEIGQPVRNTQSG